MALEPQLSVRVEPLERALDAARRISSDRLRAAGLRDAKLAEALKDARRAAFTAAWEA